MKKSEEYKDLFSNNSLRREDPARFWQEVFYLVSMQNDMVVVPFIEEKAIPKSKEQISRSPNKLPTHLCFRRLECKSPLLPFSVHVVAHKKEELKNPAVLITTFLELNDGIYMLMATFDEQSLMLEVFPPHFWKRYIQRVKQNSLRSPNFTAFDKEKLSLEETDAAVGYFVGRNWFWYTGRVPSLMSTKTQNTIQEKDYVTIFIDGFSWDDVYTCKDEDNSIVIIHKSYCTWSDLKNDQRVEEYKYKQIMLDMLIDQGYGHCLPDIITWMS
ncbi:MAG: hypothetical protein ACI3Z8_05570 [Paludibacteraceae bacterium]